jgi:hypothetical protein
VQARGAGPTRAEFATVDPEKDGRNWYVYVGADQVNLVDPLGLAADDPQASIDDGETLDPGPFGYQVDNFQTYYERNIDNIRENTLGGSPLDAPAEYVESSETLWEEVKKDNEGIIELGGKYQVVGAIPGE